MMTPRTRWRVDCSLWGLRGDAETERAVGLLRGISALYGDDFAARTTLTDDVEALRATLPPTTAATSAARFPIARFLCSDGERQDAILVSGSEHLAEVLRAILERSLHGGDQILGIESMVGADTHDPTPPPIKIFISGDRSQVGKSTVCLGLVGSLLGLGYEPGDIGYIKPATQCEQTQLIAKYCRARGIECCDIGPIVFYSGFTREFLKGNTDSSLELLAKAQAKVEEIGRGKKVVVVDGVGYPAVGSICGVSNASVAHAVQAPVVLVGKKGVGDAVDSFNLNATFFESHGVPVLGAIFNRLPADGFYSLDNCRESVSQYFARYQPQKRVYGFIPELPEVVMVGAASASTVVTEHTGSDQLTTEEAQRADRIITLFSESVDLVQLLEDARLNQGDPTLTHAPTMNKRQAPLVSPRTPVPARASVKKSRQEIQGQAQASGAAGG